MTDTENKLNAESEVTEEMTKKGASALHRYGIYIPV